MQATRLAERLEQAMLQYPKELVMQKQRQIDLERRQRKDVERQLQELRENRQAAYQAN